MINCFSSQQLTPAAEYSRYLKNLYNAALQAAAAEEQSIGVFRVELRSQPFNYKSRRQTYQWSMIQVA